MTTPTTGAAELPEALRPIQRYKIGYSTDDWGMRSSSPSGIPDTSGSWVRYADHAAQIEALSAAQAPEGGPPGSGGWQSHAEAMERERDYYRQRAKTMFEHQDGQCWYWQGDGNDHPESMVNSLPVVIRADQLRALMPQCRGKVERHSDQSVLVSFGSCHEASVFEQAMKGLAAAPQPTPSPAPAQPGQEGELKYPPFPDSDGWLKRKDGSEVLGYGPSKLLAYVDADRAARAAPQPATADAVDAAIDAFERKERGKPQAMIAAALVAELRAAINAQRGVKP